MPLPHPVAPTPRLHRLDLVLGRDRATVTVAGDVDLLAVPSLERVLASLEPLRATILVDMSDCTFLDSAGVRPLVEAARRRQADGRSPLRIGERSPAVDRLLRCTGLGGDPLLDLFGWDRLELLDLRALDGGVPAARPGLVH